MRYVVPEMEMLEFEATDMCCTLGVSGPEDNTGRTVTAPDIWD